MAKPPESPQKNPYSDTVNLPRTDFPMRGDLPRREPGVIEFWEKQDIFRKMLARAESAGAGSFTLHDGPPYANGQIHIGHALNKVLKDMTVKSRALMGLRTPYVPGWDCHGLPIEHALLKEKKMSKRAVTDLLGFRKEAVAFAERFIGIQRDEFRRLGVLGEWDAPYKTLSRDYESKVLRAFRLLYEKGYIYRGKKAVSWCVTCETALAEAEVEYAPKRSPSVFVALPILRPGKDFPFRDNGAAVLVWTTTPWTLPANLAVAFNPKLDYVLARFEREGSPCLLVAKERLAAVAQALGAPQFRTLGSWTGGELIAAGLVCATPLAFVDGFPHAESKGVAADYVSAEDGTGVVHTAPGHGADDFATGLREGLEILCPVDGAGRYTAQAGPLAGKRLFDEANAAVLELLQSRGSLLARSEIEHSYQHCWRCKNPIAFRATEQWFLSVTHAGLRANLLKAVGEVEWIPASGKERISAMVEGRPDWCLSRQRLWGTPIPLFSCAACGRMMGDDAVLEAVEKRVAAEGSDFWFAEPGRPVAFAAGVSGALRWDFVPERACAGCGGASFRRETDILDVWLDSGASWLAVLGEEAAPCDLYLEGSDQHRGWFQSSLVLAVALLGKAPYRAVLTHGFVLDDKGRAMHKSLGNVVSPQQVIGTLGADVLRLWVALADYSDDVRLSDKLLAGPTETYRKIRNTLKYLLGNIFDFDPDKDGVPYERMPELERFVLGRLARLDEEVRGAYLGYAFRKAAIALVDFCNLTLSAFYLDARKDALYTLAPGDPARRAAQTVMWECLLRLLVLGAPVLSFTCEEAWGELRRALGPGARDGLAESVFLHASKPAPSSWRDAALAGRWERILALREEIQKRLEELRAGKQLGSSLQARVRLRAGSGEEFEFLSGVGTEALAEAAIVSGFELLPPGSGERLVVERAPGAKCPRCWRYCADAGKNPPELCERCARQLG